MAFGSERLTDVRRLAIESATIRDFSGGWNLIDSQLNLSSKFSPVADNVVRGDGTNMEVRQGSIQLASFVDADADVLLNGHYFASFAMAADSAGQVFAANAAGATYTVWNASIAASAGLPAWGDCTFADMDEFKGELIICNGIDKPLKVNASLNASYLRDLATGSNVITPIARFITVVGDFVVMAGDYANPSTLYISHQGSSGTWAGDAGSNGINVDMSGKVVQGSPEITGLAEFRGQLLVFFAECVIPMTLGNFVSSVHTPEYPGAIRGFGTISHRSIASLGDDVLFCDGVGVASIALSALATNATLKPSRLSSLIDPGIQKQLARLSVLEQAERVFSIYDRLEGRYMLFIPNEGRRSLTYETYGFVFKNITALKISAWSRFRDWNWNGGFVSSEGRLAFLDDKRIFIAGSRTEQLPLDFIGYEEMFTDGTVFSDRHGFTPVATDTWAGGVPINFDWELPWIDFKNRALTKTIKSLTLDTTGRSRFTLQLFTDQKYIDRSQLGEAFTDDEFFSDGIGFMPMVNVPYTPAFEMAFRGGEVYGYGGDGYGVQYGAGRPTNTERLYAVNVKGKLHKARFSGQSKGQLGFIAVTFNYSTGTVYR